MGEPRFVPFPSSKVQLSRQVFEMQRSITIPNGTVHLSSGTPDSDAAMQALGTLQALSASGALCRHALPTRA